MFILTESMRHWAAGLMHDIHWLWVNPDSSSFMTLYFMFRYICFESKNAFASLHRYIFIMYDLSLLNVGIIWVFFVT